MMLLEERYACLRHQQVPKSALITFGDFLMLYLASLLLALVPAVRSAYCHGKPDPNAPANTFPFVTTEPVLNKTVTNGKLFSAGPPDQPFWIIHVYGTSYERGFAQGALMGEIARDMLNDTWNYMVEQAASNLGNLPPWLADLIAEVGMDIALEVTYDWTSKYTDPGFYEEMHGLADGAGVDFTILRDIHLIGSLTQGDCSLIGAWGDATQDGKTLQLRALDWDTGTPFRHYHAVLVEHPTDGGHAYASVGFVGWLGALTGISEEGMAISEIGIAFPDATFGNESRVGIPFVVLLRDILLYDKTLNDTITRIKEAHRTCDLVFGVGHGAEQKVLMFEYSETAAYAMDDKNLRPLNTTWHNRMSNVVYLGMDWDCPGYNLVLQDELQKYHGSLTPDNIAHEITARTQTGSTHIAVYDLTEQVMYVAFLDVNDNPAYTRPYTQLDAKKLFSEPKP